jgi:hypothetical protein
VSDFNISIDLGPVMQAGDVITRAILPRVREAVGAVAQAAQTQWADAVMKAPGVWSEEKKAYASSIKWEYTGEFSARVSTDYDKADQIENGRPARDLKVMLNTSAKVRRTESGKRFLIIPMRHNTPGNDAHAPSMPAGVAAMAAQLAPSRITGTGQRPAGQVMRMSPKTGMHPSPHQSPYMSNPGGGHTMVAKHEYQWGEKLKRSDMRAAGMSAADRKRYGGMYRFDTTGKGGVKSSSFLTFRVMVEGSPGWIVPAKPGLHLVAGVTAQLRPIADEVIRKAAQLDLS